MKTIKYSINLLFVFSFILLSKAAYPQTCYSIYVDTIISNVSPQLIKKYNRELSGDTSTIIGGEPYRIISRFYLSEGNPKAAQYIYEKFQSFGLAPEYQVYSPTGTNVIAKKTGLKYPNQSLIICAHYDDYKLGAIPPDTVPGADDNATGVCGVLEAARLLSPYNPDYTIVFALWDEEETGTWGSRVYADSAYYHGDSIIGVINLDMIGWDSNNDFVFNISTVTNSFSLAERIYISSIIYLPSLTPVIRIGDYPSDNRAFSLRNYKAVAIHEDFYDSSPYIHSKYDTYNNINIPFLTETIKASVCAAANIALNYNISFIHTQINSSSDTTELTTKAVIKSKWGIDKSQNAPRLYYKNGNNPFNYVTPSNIELDTFKFIIPGQPKGSTISYYLAAQDSIGAVSGTYPYGGWGLNPPGSHNPQSQFVYHIDNTISKESGTLPKSIGPKQNVFDTITINQSGLASDVNIYLNIQHTNDSDLFIYAIGPEMELVVPLSLKNGGTGDDYILTLFDDEASTSITEGTPPFMGPFKPQNELNLFDNNEIHGKWILRVYNNSSTITGNLTLWKIFISYYNPISVTNESLPLNFSLSQNHPNPFNPITKIEFAVNKEVWVKIILYDILGREIKALINDKIIAGSYSISFDGSGLTSGIYFYSMYTDGILFKTKKMVLIK